MEITNGLLVAMMFIVIITIGIGDTLMAITGAATRVGVGRIALRGVGLTA